MKKTNNKDDKNSEFDYGKRSQINKKSSETVNDSNPDIINKYKEIVSNYEQRKNNNGNVGAIILCIIILLFVCFNIYMVEFEKHEIKMIKENQGKIAENLQSKLKKIKEEIAKKNKDSSDIIYFNDKYLKIRQDFYIKVKEISEKTIDIKADSLDDIKQLTSERIMLAKNYKSQISSLEIPDILSNFYGYEMEFLDSDIKLWTLINSYYLLEDFSNFDSNKIDEANKKSHELYLKAQEELKTVYNKYELGYFLKDLLIIQ